MSNEENKKIFSENLKRYMKEKDKVRGEICQRLGVPYTSFVEWEKGRVMPRMDKIQRLAMYFGVEMSDLLEKAPESTEAETEAEVIDRAMILYDALVKCGYIKNGADISKRQLDLLTNFANFVGAVFNNSDD